MRAQSTEKESAAALVTKSQRLGGGTAHALNTSVTSENTPRTLKSVSHLSANGPRRSKVPCAKRHLEMCQFKVIANM